MIDDFENWKYSKSVKQVIDNLSEMFFYYV